MNKNEFAEKGYTLVKNAVSKEVVNFITQYALFDEMQDFTPDDQVPGAHIKYADPAMETLLLKLHPVIEEATGLSVYPTYSYYRIYRPGDELKPHKDRPSCEISITVSLGFDYQGADYSYPIYINGEAYSLNPGDLVCYRGVDLEHWRNKFEAPEGSWHVQAFLHYVDIHGPYANYKYDERDSIGINKKNKKPTPPKSYISFT